MNKTSSIWMAFIAGLAVVTAALVCGRLLAPVFGASSLLSTTILTTALAAFGAGALAAAAAPARRPAIAFVCAGAWMLAAGLAASFIRATLGGVEWREAPMVAAIAILAPPSALLGACFPQLVREAARTPDPGRAVGEILGIAALGGVAGAALCMYFLIPVAGVSAALAGTGVLLAITGLIGAWKASGLPAAAGMFILPAGALFASMLGAGGGTNAGEVLLVREDVSGEVRVTSNIAGRHLLLDGAVVAAVDTFGWQSSIASAAVLNIPKYFFPGKGSVFVAGLEGAAVARNYSSEGWEVEVAEPEAAIVEAARDYFGLSVGTGAIMEEDGRKRLSAAARPYDVVIINAFAGFRPAWHLLTRESFESAARYLNKDGILAVSVENAGWHGGIVACVAASISASFSHVVALPIAEPPDRFGSVILLGSQSPLELFRQIEREDYDPDYRWTPAYQMNHAWDNRFVPKTEGAPMITDDCNRLEQMYDRVNMLKRVETRRYFSRERLEW